MYKELVKKLSERTFFVWSTIHSTERYLIVGIEEAHFLGVLDKISSKSKISKTSIYLEGERDAKIFSDAYRRIFGKMHLGDLKYDGSSKLSCSEIIAEFTKDYTPDEVWEKVTEH